MMAANNAVEQNNMARQILVAQQRVHEKFLYRPDMDAVYSISGASAERSESGGYISPSYCSTKKLPSYSRCHGGAHCFPMNP